MEDILKLTLLYDFYGELLTDKQKHIYEMFYQNDLSLTEIGEELGITRQGVRDQLKHAERKLFDFENKLHLLERFQKQQKSISISKEELEKLNSILNRETSLNRDKDADENIMNLMGSVIKRLTSLINFIGD